jgi:signal transduction histidine kinase
MKKEHRYFILEVFIGALVGFFFLHPVSMLLTGGMDKSMPSFNINFHHMLYSPMAWYFTLIGTVLAAIAASTRITIQRKNIVLKKQHEEINKTKLEFEQQNQELIKLNTDKNLLLSIIGHDLKNQFYSTFGFSTLLQANIREYDIKKIEKQIGYINCSAQQAINLLDDLILWTNNQSGKLLFNPEKLNLTNTSIDVLEGMNFTAFAKSITLTHFASNEIDVYADKNMIKAILRNLISNAIKFTKSGGKVNVFIEQNNSNAVLTVSDNGVGIESDRFSKLFDISQNRTTNGTANEKGTGLGLLLCKDFVEKHGGEIWVESEFNKGSSFKFSIPINTQVEK